MAKAISIGHLINRTARLMRQLADQRLAPLGLSSGQLPVLTALMDHEAMSQRVLTEHAGIEQPTMAATLARMERDHIVERIPDPNDGRSSLFSLTAGTRANTAAIRVVIESISVDALARLPTEDRERFRDNLETVIASVEAELLVG